jgi:hypothetical protein
MTLSLQPDLFFVHFLMKRPVLFFCAAVLLLLSSFTASAPVDLKTEPVRYQLTGRISDTVSTAPACGCFAFATTIEMDIITYSDTGYKGDHIVVVYTCPSMKEEEFFRVGSEHTFTVEVGNPASFGWIIMDSEKLNENSLPYELYVVDDGTGGK